MMNKKPKKRVKPVKLQKEKLQKKKITYVDGDDWKGLYINDKLVMENHELDIEKIFKACKIPCKFVNANIEWLGNRGNLPENLNEVVFEDENYYE